MFEILEEAVSLGHIFLGFIIKIIVSSVIGLITSQLRKSLRDGLVVFVLSEAILISLFFIVRGEVKNHRLQIVSKTMSTIDTTHLNCNIDGVHIANYREGLKLIKRCPTEAGYYITTADLLEKDRDYESAATLIEMGLDFLRQDPPSPPLCERLKRYYEHLPNRTKLDDKCGKFHEL